MGLNERRKIKELQETTLPERVKEIEEICGKAISYEVDWDSLADDAQQDLACRGGADGGTTIRRQGGSGTNDYVNRPKTGARNQQGAKRDNTE